MRKGVVSILTPAYNGEGLIHRLLDSVLRQTYPHVAMVVVNDGSTDRTEDVVKSYIPKFEARGYSLSIHNQPNGGQSNAINNGLKLVDGEYLVWPDCDDWYATDDAIAKLVARLAQYGDDVGVSRCAYNWVSEGDFKIICTHYPCMGEEPEYVFEKSVLCRPCFWFTPGGWMLNAKFLDELIPGRDIYQNKSAGQNAQLLWPYLFAKKCVSVEEPMFNYQIRESSHSRGMAVTTEKKLMQQETYYKTYTAVLNSINGLDSKKKEKLLAMLRFDVCNCCINIIIGSGDFKKFRSYNNELHDLEKSGLIEADIRLKRKVKLALASVPVLRRVIGCRVKFHK